MTLEQELLILTNRLTFSERDTRRINEIINQKIDWFEFFKMSFYHKNATLCWCNLKKTCPHIYIPKYLNYQLRFMYLGIKRMNETYQEEMSHVVNELKKIGIIVMPVKGMTLIPQLYKDFGIRFSGDADFLIEKIYVKKLDQALRQMGFTKGFFQEETNSIKNVSREDELMWKIHMSNLFPYVKLLDNKLNPVIKLDFRFSLDDSLSEDAVNEILDNFRIKGKEKPAYILTHLCTHFYDEAKHIETINLFKDINLIKLCDIREYIFAYLNEEEMNCLIEFVKIHNLQKQVYYAFYWLLTIYNDGYEQRVMEKLGLKNYEFLNTFGKNTINNQIEYPKGMWERLFSCDNRWNENVLGQ